MLRADKVRRKNINNLQKERANCDFNQVAMGSLIHGTREKMEKFLRTGKKFAKDPIMKNKFGYHNLSREEKMQVGYEKLARMTELIHEPLSSDNAWQYSSHHQSQVRVCNFRCP